MDVLLAGVKRVSGVAGAQAKSPGRAFDMAHVLVLDVIEQIDRENLKITGFGYEAMEIPVSPESVASFSGLKFPCNVKLMTRVEKFGGSLKTIVVGFEK